MAAPARARPRCCGRSKLEGRRKHETDQFAEAAERELLSRAAASSLGTSADGKSAVIAYFIMGRSDNSRNRVFVEDGDGLQHPRL